jgi:hypothetical protein
LNQHDTTQIQQQLALKALGVKLREYHSEDHTPCIQSFFGKIPTILWKVANPLKLFSSFYKIRNAKINLDF